MSLILTALADSTVSVLNTDTNVRLSYTATRCKWGAHLNAPAVCYVWYEDQLIAAVSDDPSLYPGSSILGATTGTTAVAALTAQPLITPGGGGGGGSAALVDITPGSIAQLTPGLPADLPGANTVIGQLKRLVQLGTDDRDFTEIILTETTGLKRTVVRQTVYNENTGLFSTSFVNVDGTALVPPVVLPVVPAVSTDDIEIVAFSYHAVGSGPGYTVGDLLEQVRLINTVTATVTTALWFNRSTGNVLASPPVIVNIKPDSHQLEDQITSLTSYTGYQRIRLYYISNVNDPVNGTSIGDLIEAQDTYRGGVLDNTLYTNLSTGLTIPVGASIPDWSPIDYENYLAERTNNNLLTAATDPLTAPYVNIADSFSGKSASVVPGGTTVDNTADQLVIGISPDSNKVKITDGTNTVAVNPGSGLPSLYVTTTSGSAQPNITPATRAYTQLTDGSSLSLLRLSTPFLSDAGLVVRQAPDALGHTVRFGTTEASAPNVRITDGAQSVLFSTTNPTGPVYGIPVRLPIDSAGNQISFGSTAGTAPFMKLTDPGGNPLNFASVNPGVGSLGLPVRLPVDAAGNTVVVGNTLATAPWMKITDGTDTIDITASPPATTAFGLPTRSIPDAAGNTQTISSTITTALFSRITDGVNTAVVSNSPAVGTQGLIVRQGLLDASGNTQKIGATIATGVNTILTDGVTSGKILAGSTLPVVADPALVVSLSPNSLAVSRGVYTSGLPTVLDGTSSPLAIDVNSRLITVNAPPSTVQFGTTSPAADIAVTAGKRIYRLLVSNNTGTVFFLQLHSNTLPLVTGSIPSNGLIFRVPGNSSFVLGEETFGAVGELIPNLRIGFSTTFVNYTAVAGAVLINCSLNYKISA